MFGVSLFSLYGRRFCIKKKERGKEIPTIGTRSSETGHHPPLLVSLI